MHESQNIAVIARFLDEVVNQGHLDAADEIVVEDFVELDPLPGQRQGREGLKEIIAIMRSAFHNMHWVGDETIASGDKVVTRFTWTGTHRGPFLGIPATGKDVKVKGMVIDRLLQWQNGRQPHANGHLEPAPAARGNPLTRRYVRSDP